ncbi:Fc.00g079160.m01.CDS01 [Cosmosporella sp. VM-42]
MHFGLLSSFHVTPTCPLCRLIYRIIPRPPPDHDHSVLSLTPFQWYIRQDAWEAIPREARKQFATWFGLAAINMDILTGPSLFADGERFRLAAMAGEAIALLSEPSSSTDKKFNARLVDEMIDFAPIRKALEYCVTSHPTECQPKFHIDLLSTRMVDVIARETVPCPDNCDYLALSYVWGGVHPTAGALKAGTLPQTIEDAITITKKLDMSPEQRAAKEKQLSLMHLIYNCATVTIFAVSGQNSNHGIPGVSQPRIPSTRETISGKTVFTVPPEVMVEVQASVWNTRSWTFQEDTLSNRRLFFTESQYQLQCNETLGPSHLSEACDTADRLTWTFLSGGKMKAGFVEAEDKAFLDRGPGAYESMLSNYTSRSLTNEEDSLNAIQGALTWYGLRLYPDGFLWGMPLKNFPQSLGWIHDYTVKPKRRASFPSWSWAGWEGMMGFPPGLINTTGGETDLLPSVERLNGKELTLGGWVVTLDIRTEPFSEVVVPGSDKAVGCVTERNFKHNNTLGTGKYKCLVVARVKTNVLKNGLNNQQVFLLVLNGSKVAQRQTVVTFSRLALEGKDFMEFEPVKEQIKLI